MSMALLMAHPKTFLKTNAVWVHGSLNVMTKGKPETVGSTGVGKVYPVQLQSAKGKTCKDQNGAGNMPCWEIVPAVSLGDTTLAFYLPYRQNHTSSMLLGDKAKLFLTDNINGCTFAAGKGGAPLVSHLNFTEGRVEGTKIDQEEIDRELDRLFPSGDIVAVKKAQYRTDDQFPDVTVLGVCSGGGWKFVYQRRDYLGPNQYQLRSVHSVKSLP